MGKYFKKLCVEYLGLLFWPTLDRDCLIWNSRRPQNLTRLTLVPATGVFLPPSAVLAENRQLNNGLKQLFFVTLSQTLLAF